MQVADLTKDDKEESENPLTVIASDSLLEIDGTENLRISQKLNSKRNQNLASSDLGSLEFDLVDNSEKRTRIEIELKPTKFEIELELSRILE